MDDRSKHGRHIRDARELATRLKEEGQHFEADTILRLVRSSESSRAENKRINKLYRELIAVYNRLVAEAHGG
jgi:hypothetical protein